MNVNPDPRTLATPVPPATTARPDSKVPRALRRYLSLNDFEPAAKRKLPRMLYGYISGGAETDASVRDNREAYQDYGLVPRVLMDVSGRDTSATLFGKRYAAPFGIPRSGRRRFAPIAATSC